MSARKIILGFAVCFSLGILAQQVLSQSTGSGGFSGGAGHMRSRNTRPPGMPGRPDFERMQNMSPEEKMKYYQQFLEEQRKAMEQQESLAMQRALGASDEQWKVIEPIVPKLQWERPWKYTPLFEMTEAQRLAQQIRILLEKKDTPPEVFRRKIAALRKARSKEAEIQKQLAEARRELREILTTRQEAVLVLKGWL